MVAKFRRMKLPKILKTFWCNTCQLLFTSFTTPKNCSHCGSEDIQEIENG